MKKGTGILYDTVILQLCEPSIFTNTGIPAHFVYADVLREVMGFSRRLAIACAVLYGKTVSKRKRRKIKKGGRYYIVCVKLRTVFIMGTN